MKVKKPSILSLPGLINVFVAYSFLGWLYELIINKYGNTELVGKVIGFGPFRPYYGIIGVAITLIFTYFILPQLRRKGIVRVAVLVLAVSVFSSFIINFITSFTLDKALGIQIWDFSKSSKENIMIFYSMLSGVKHGILAAFGLALIYPGVTRLMLRMGRRAARIQSLVLTFILFGNTIIGWFYKVMPYIESLKK